MPVAAQPGVEVWMGALTGVHARLGERGVYAAGWVSVAAGALLWGRYLWTGRPWFAFLVVNLALAWVPFAISAVAAGSARRWVQLAAVGPWLLFFPNAPYLVTDLIHLADRPPVPLWYDAAMLATFAGAGVLLGLLSLRHWEEAVRRTAGWMAAWGFVAAVALLSGLGIYLGRFLRWNSWDAVLQPRAVLWDVGERLLQPGDDPRAWAVTLLFTGLLLCGYAALRSSGPAAAPR